MFNWFRQFSVVSRLRAMALLAVAGVIGVACALMWASYQQQLAARQTSARQAVEVAYSTLQWVHARLEAGELKPLQAQKVALALATLGKLRDNGNAAVRVNDMSPRVAQAFVAIGLVLVTALILWGLIEIVRTPPERPRRVGPIRTAGATRDQIKVTQHGATLVEDTVAAAVEAGSPQDQVDAMTLVVSRFRVAGAF